MLQMKGEHDLAEAGYCNVISVLSTKGELITLRTSAWAC